MMTECSFLSEDSHFTLFVGLDFNEISFIIMNISAIQRFAHSSVSLVIDSFFGVIPDEASNLSRRLISQSKEPENCAQFFRFPLMRAAKEKRIYHY